MNTSLRRNGILKTVDREGYVSISDLIEKFDVSPVTIHRDLGYLSSTGMISRVRGGARSVSGNLHDVPTDYAIRRGQAQAEKLAIARRALDEIADRSTLFLDSSTTVLALAKLLENEPKRGLTIVTNSPAIGFQLVAPQVHIVQLPGELNQELRSLTGRWTVEFINEVSFSTAFVSAAGISLDTGLLTTQRELAEVTKAAFARASRRIALIDSSKFGVSAFVTMAPTEQLDMVITDSGLPAETVTKYLEKGINLVQVDL